MNREIKFRGKVKGFDNWIYGFYFEQDIKNVMNGITECHGYIISSRKESYATEIKIETVGQYTGLHDKNGKEIYEGDIVLLDCYHYEEPAFDGEFEVIYDDINGMWILVDLEDKKNIYTFENIRGYYKTEIEVIGNIYENSELLGGE